MRAQVGGDRRRPSAGGRELDRASVRGGELEAHGPYSVVEALPLATDLLEGLEACHRAGVIHRDLKPENVFIGPDPGLDVRVVDFSIALLQDAERLTRTGMILGTFQYMSPEQVRGDKALDARSDLWSLGAILYECAAGRCPFQSPTLAGLVYSIAFQEPEPVSRHRQGVPPQLAEVIRRALSKDPAERYPTGAELADARENRGAQVGVFVLSSVAAASP